MDAQTFAPVPRYAYSIDEAARSISITRRAFYNLIVAGTVRTVKLGTRRVVPVTAGKPKYLLSGLLRCASCGSHYIIANALEYQCSSYRDGASCSNGIRVRREDLEASILGPVRKELLSPERVALMAKEMQSYYAERVRAMQTRAAEAPKELRDLTARIERLRERLKKGDPDMTADEIQVAIERAEAKRPLPRLFTAQLRHTQSGLDAISAHIENGSTAREILLLVLVPSFGRPLGTLSCLSNMAPWVRSAWLFWSDQTAVGRDRSQA